MVQEYRDYAELCQYLAECTAEEHAKARFLNLANSWLKLAQRVEENRAADFTFERPLLREE